MSICFYAVYMGLESARSSIMALQFAFLKVLLRPEETIQNSEKILVLVKEQN